MFKKAVSAIMLIVLWIGMLALVSKVQPSEAYEIIAATEMSVINPDTGDTNFIFYTNTTALGTRFNATVWLYGVADLYAYQVYLGIDDTLLNITNAWLPTWDPNWVFYGKSSVRPLPTLYDFNGNDYMEYVKVADTIMGIDSFTGSGTLAVIEFEIIYAPNTGSVSCNLDIDNPDTYLLNFDMDEIPTTKTSGYYEFNYVPVPVHDVAITDVKPWKTVVGQGMKCKINVTAANEGSFLETLNITAYANATSVGSQTVSLSCGDSTTIIFEWDTTGYVMGVYTISAYVKPVPGETDLADNTYVDGDVIITIAGDIDGDGDVDYKDLFLLARAYGSTADQPSYVPNADLDCSGKIDYKDLFILARNYGKKIDL